VTRFLPVRLLTALSSLKYRIAGSIFFLEAVLMVVVLGLTLDRIEENTRKHTRETERVIAELLAGVGQTALFSVEFGELQQYVEEVGRDPNIRRVLVSNRNGRVVASNRFSEVGQMMPAIADSENFYWRLRPLENLGQIAIEFSILPMQETRREAIKVGVVTALIGMFYIALMGVGFGYLLTRQLTQLSAAAREIGDGNLSTIIDTEGHDEVAVLAATLDGMQSRIRDNIRALEQHQAELVAARDELELRVRERTAALEVANEKLRELSEADPLTRIANRRRFDDAIDKEVRRAHRSNQPLSVLMLDVDFFKRYNDRYGHVQGDHCLIAVAGAIARAAGRRPGDVVARYGGEEFAVILPDTPLAGAGLVADRILQEVRALALPHESSGVAAQVTVSVGYSCYQKTDLLILPEHLVGAADTALYSAKHGGRNRIVGQELIASIN